MQLHTIGIDLGKTQTRGSHVLDVEQGMRLSAVLEVRLARGTARDGQWCEINHRPVDWASRSLTREFEHVIMVDVPIGEMVGSNRSSTRKIAASLWC
jgi:hypothetical protein